MSRSISPGTEEAAQKRRSTSNMESIRYVQELRIEQVWKWRADGLRRMLKGAN